MEATHMTTTTAKGNPVIDRSNQTRMKLYDFWTDDGDQDAIEAESLEQATQIASMRITTAEWADGAWGYVKGEDAQQMDVPSRQQPLDLDSAREFVAYPGH